MTTNNAKVRRLIARIAAAERLIAGYSDMLVVAERFGMEYELERIPGNIIEMESELEEAIEEAIAAGLEPEDLEDAGIPFYTFAAR